MGNRRMRHAGQTSDNHPTSLCGIDGVKCTQPGETVDCPDCRVILDHVRSTYPEHARYSDWRASANVGDERYANP